MKKFIALCLTMFCGAPLWAQIGTRFPSERKVINDPKTGVELVFLTTKSGTGDSKMDGIAMAHFRETFKKEFGILPSEVKKK